MAGTTLNKAIARILFDEITVGCSVATVAELTGYSPRTVNNWCEGVCAPPLDKLLHLVRVVSAEDPPRGLRLWDRISALLGMQARPAPTPAPEAPVASLALSVSSAEGAVSEWVAKAMEDGAVQAHEVPEGKKRVRLLRYRTDTLDAAITGIENAGPQRSLEVR